MKKLNRNILLLSSILLMMVAVGCRSGSSLENRTYQVSVSLEGGSGRASVTSPAAVTVKDGQAVARIIWSSPHYDYMIVDDEKYLPVNEDGNSEFEIPLKDLAENFEGELEVQADTTAMGEPHLIDYTLKFSGFADASSDTDQESQNPDQAGDDADHSESVAFKQKDLEVPGTDQTKADLPSTENSDAKSANSGNGKSRNAGNSSESTASDKSREKGSGTKQPASETVGGQIADPPELSGISYRSTDQNAYASCYRIYRYADGYASLAVDDGRVYVIVPGGKAVPKKISAQGADVTVLQQPLDRIYLAASAAMCQFDTIRAISDVKLSGLKEDGWYIDAARQAMKNGTMKYGGKYSAPDYETILADQTKLAIESTMILHVPKVKEKLEELGIPVLIERSSYETDPLGRCEWVKVFGLLAGREKEAKRAFSEQEQYVKDLPQGQVSGKKVAIFSINSNRQIVTRRPEDYFAKMIEVSGGTYVTPVKAGTSKTSTVAVSVEEFYRTCADADILIYNGTIEEIPTSVKSLAASNRVFSDFKAFQNGQIWYSDKSFYQNANATGKIIDDLNVILSGRKEEPEYFKKLK